MLEYKAALLTLSLAIASLLSGAVSGIFLETFYNVGFATALTRLSYQGLTRFSREKRY
ncbi:MAG: hypothetical protein QW463_06595 [Candidatus Caldarchaeum sp.]